MDKGQFFGEMSCLTGDSVSATVKAGEEVLTLSMARAGMLLLMDSSAVFRTHMIEAMVKRIQSSNDRVVEEHTKSQLFIKQNESEDRHRYGELIGNSPQMQEMRRQIERLSRQEGSICIQGEPGVGKTHAAKRIHYCSSKESYPLLTVNGSDFDMNSWDIKVRAAKGGTIVLQDADLLPMSILDQVATAGGETRVIITGTPTIQWSQLVRLTFPRHSFVHNEPMIKFIESYIGPKRFEDLNIPFAAVASDANTGEAHILRTGSVSRAICASTAIPAVMRPVSYEGKTLVDGAVVHPVPAALVKSMGADIVIAVNVCEEPFEKKAATNFISTILNTIDIMSAKMVKEELQLADVILKPQMSCNQFNFKGAPQNIQAGEQVTREALAAIRSKLDFAM